jgi:hypothetical protein
MLAVIGRKRAANPEKAYTGNTVLAVQMRTPTDSEKERFRNCNEMRGKMLSGALKLRYTSRYTITLSTTYLQ